MQYQNIPEDKLKTMLEIAGKKLGKDPAQLRAELQAGKWDNVLGSLDAKTAQQVGGYLNNPEALKTLLSNSNVQTLLNGLMGKK